MERFDRAQILRFLHALDACLLTDVKIVVVGGTAALIGYQVDDKTADIDIYEMPPRADENIKRASACAREATGIYLDVGRATVAELPYYYEDRARPARGVRFKHLTLIVPDKYDLVLSKMLRGDHRDMTTIQAIHKLHRLAEKTLVRRFEEEVLGVATGDPRLFKPNMVDVIELLYGTERATVYRNHWIEEQPLR